MLVQPTVSHPPGDNLLVGSKCTTNAALDLACSLLQVYQWVGQVHGHVWLLRRVDEVYRRDASTQQPVRVLTMYIHLG